METNQILSIDLWYAKQDTECRGCITARCCCNLVMCTVHEAEQILDYYDEDVSDLFEVAATLVNATRIDFRYWPCFFLDEEKKRCKIYAARPLICRAHCVAPGTNCDDPQSVAVGRIDCPHLLADIHAAEILSFEAGSSPGLHPLPVALALAYGHKELLRPWMESVEKCDEHWSEVFGMKREVTS
jgi:Fe-S-cluster containining protein